MPKYHPFFQKKVKTHEYFMDKMGKGQESVVGCLKGLFCNGFFSGIP